jgi:hypothetical protein
MRRALLISLGLLLGACLADYDVEGMTFPCRAPDDCVEGYECHPMKYVCVKTGTSSTAVGLDAGLAD